MLKAKVFGFVQGVNYRAFVKKFADEKGIKGYVKNLSDGSVEVMADGIKADLDTLLDHMRKGPIFAKVAYVDYSFSLKNGNFMSFKIVRDRSYLLDQIEAYHRFFISVACKLRLQI